jgi:hypothetical protein
MVAFSRTFENELGNEVTITVTYTRDTVTISATSATSEVEHQWTRMEAAVIRALLNPELIEPVYKNPSNPE